MPSAMTGLLVISNRRICEPRRCMRVLRLLMRELMGDRACWRAGELLSDLTGERCD